MHIILFVFRIHMENTIVSLCRAIVQEGPRKGQSCCFPPDDSGYCGRHIRNKEYDEGIAAGKIWCRFFFRGCNNLCTDGAKSCKECRDNMYVGKSLCKHSGCNHHLKSNEQNYCKKHERDIYRDEEKSKGIRYCDIARGCMNICKDGCSTCDSCLEKNRMKENALYNQRKQLHTAIQHISSSTQQICCQCGKDYPIFLTQHGKPSTKCNECNKNQAIQDDKRKDRIRNYKMENRINSAKHFREYFRNAMKRNLVFLLTIEEFQEMVIQPCQYCGYSKENEVNGIDRIDNSVGYISTNVTTACSSCNRIKHMFHPGFFLKQCRNIIEKTCSRLHVADWPEYYKHITHCFKYYTRMAEEKRGIEWSLNESDYITLTKGACYLCSYRYGPVGIDRVNPSLGYHLDNCKPCCSPCNMMKNSMTYEAFMNTITDIVACDHDESIYSSIPHQEYIFGRKATITSAAKDTSSPSNSPEPLSSYSP